LTVNLDEPTLRNITPKEQAGRIVQKNNLLLEKSGGGELQPVGCVVLYEHDCVAVCSNFVAKVELAQGMNPSYWRYVHASTYSVRLNTRSIKQTSGIQNLDHQQYFDEMAPFPPLQEQEEVASFLDQETAKIDALITDQQRLIELLKEKRQAVISYAVTKGLNPDVRMKPSGVEWLGEVPEHWSLIPLKHCVKLLTDKAAESSFPVALENVQSWTGNFVPCEGEFSGEGVAFEVGDILFGKLRPYLAKAFLADRAGEAVGDFHVLRPKAGVFSRWLQYRILSREFIAEINSASFGSKMPRVSWEFMGSMPIPLPPKQEQQAVVHKLDRELVVIDELVLDADKSIALLQERRTALISAAVTGKIDVRNHASTQRDAA
jgi:type I restriction enzyme S subunit